ncbi:N-acetyltransferase [Rhodobacteraceae bacterium CCMM004]|nr:N-acetyltransferase [Rhodobacteraceae bacterium CCMM004]
MSVQPTGGTVVEIPTFETARLRLRAPRWDDFDTYVAFLASPRSEGVGGPYTRDEAFPRFCTLIGHWHMRGYGRWLVADRETDAPLGIVGPMFPEGWPEPEIAWSVFDGAEGRGIAHEAALFARAYAYDVLGWATVISCTAPGNTRSEALARRMGAVHDGVCQHPHGPLTVWRHPAPAAVREGAA